jgi:hypothetical protein
VFPFCGSCDESKFAALQARIIFQHEGGKSMKKFDLFFDESGNFEEESLLKDTESNTVKDKRASQIVGILAEENTMTETKAMRILEKAFAMSNHELPDFVHGTEIFRNSHRIYQTLIDSVLNSITELWLCRFAW